MASLLRQIVAGPRARHPEAGLDLCYVTDKIIATSGPSGTYPQRAYRNPLDALVKFLDCKHKDNWAIWEFRAEGTGYPDSEVYGRIKHYPFPDHHPPPFALIPHIMASMRNWLHEDKDRVVVVHCKAGKGRSGTASCSYLISEEGWKVEDALQRFTERRMRPGFGAGVSIPSQLRWIGYVDRWTKHGKIYVERQVEVMEVHVWGLRDGVKIAIEGFVDDGRTIKTFHAFQRSEREVVRGKIPNSGGLADVLAEVMGRNSGSKTTKSAPTLNGGSANSKALMQSSTLSSEGAASPSESDSLVDGKEETNASGGDAIFRPASRVVLPTNDLNIDFERRNKAAYGLTMVTSVAHVWFNAFFEGNGPENDGKADDSGVFEIEWDKMDGIKGSSRKGTRAFDKLAVVWRALGDESGQPPVVIHEPKEGEEVKQTQPADWKGTHNVAPHEHTDLGLRAASPAASSTNVSRANSIKSQTGVLSTPNDKDDETEGVRSHGPNGEDQVEAPSDSSEERRARGPLPISKDLPQPTHTRLHSGTGKGYEQDADPSADAVPRAQSPASLDRTGSGIVGGIQHVSTGDLPDGRPEEEMHTSSGHSLGHLKQAKNTSTSS
ncbi:phosphatidylinositol-3,4,5-trisphosphate 3-phosphatase [Glonium stellatum]|uniref:phosphatidylinositol-3,4,5-trisphosphate 3-phosphatase n=1 Tax=Glonium stellatum TaxID=574774 RepID=A0A8E2ERW0_9PEZI|nr:phosphatidylinositol-3,4,5-trisphosphate 3-phosphatase [Glonium stellatum]